MSSTDPPFPAASITAASRSVSGLSPEEIVSTANSGSI